MSEGIKKNPSQTLVHDGFFFVLLGQRDFFVKNITLIGGFCFCRHLVGRTPAPNGAGFDCPPQSSGRLRAGGKARQEARMRLIPSSFVYPRPKGLVWNQFALRIVWHRGSSAHGFSRRLYTSYPFALDSIQCNWHGFHTDYRRIPYIPAE